MRAERSGIIAEIFSGRATLRAYSVFLRNLLPVYEALERALWRHRHTPELASLVRPELFRAAAIEHDLSRLAALQGPLALPLLREANDYVQRLEVASEDATQGLLIAHVYTRYLGDLAGGRILGRRLAEVFALPPDALTSYAFPEIAELAHYARELRCSIDAAARSLSNPDAVLEEAETAFALNIALSEAVLQDLTVR